MVSKIAGMRGDIDVTLRKRTAVIMCADNGVVREGVSQSDSSVTAAVAREIASGRSSVNLLAEQFGVDALRFFLMRYHRHRRNGNREHDHIGGGGFRDSRDTSGAGGRARRRT